MTPRLPLVFNPLSGPSGKDGHALVARLGADLRARLEPIPLEPPFDYGRAIAQARAAGGPLVVWGGDGTVHFAARALLEAGCPVPLAALPGGSGNGLVRGLKTPLDPARALVGLLEGGRELAMDVGRLDGEPFFNLCGTGFEAAVAHDFDREPGRGFRTYARIVFREWRSAPDLALRWEAAPQGLPGRAWSLCFAILPQYGSGLYIAPGADPTDGLLQWAKISRPGWIQALAQAPIFFREHGRSHLRQEGRLAGAVLRLEGPAPWHLDGEPAAARDRAELSIQPRAFRMWVTRTCPWS